VCFAEVFEQEPPTVGVGVPFRLETSRQETRRRRGRDLAIEFDLLPPAAPAAGEAFWQAGLEDQRLRRARGLALIGEAQANDAGEYGRSRLFRFDRSDLAAVSEDA
jgi:hypothetical protein